MLVVEAFSLQKVIEILEEVILGWREVRWIWWMRQNFVAQFVQLLKHWLYNMLSSLVVEKNWALSVDQCWLQAVQFLVHLIHLLSIVLRCNGFTKIQKAIVDQIHDVVDHSNPSLSPNHWCWKIWSLLILWRSTRPSGNNTKQQCPFHHRGLECKSRKSRDTWGNRQVWPWRTKWSRTKANRVLSRKHNGHSKHPFPATQERALHMDINRWSIPKSDWLYSLQLKIEKLYTVSKNKTRSWLWLRSWAPYCKIQA